MNISGKIKLINETKEYGSNGFRKRELVVTTQEQYPQNILVEFVQDRCELLDSYNIGELVKIDISLETMKEEKSIIEDLIVAAHNNAKSQLKSKTSEELTNATGGLGIPGFKW